MHIEPGVLNTAKVISANAAALATLAVHVRGMIQAPLDLLKTVMAAAFFSIFMEIWHMPVGPSELHFIGASAIYFIFGFRPTLFGFAFGLLLQGVLFEPQDLVHLGVNALSLMIPLIAVHATVGQALFASSQGRKLTLATILRFDALYYSGVVGMVGFWLFLSQDTVPLTDWGVFALSYVPLMVLEPCFTWIVFRQLKRVEAFPMVSSLTVVRQLSVT